MRLGIGDREMNATAAPTLVSAEEFLRLHGDDSGVELVDGQIVRVFDNGAEHGYICGNVGAELLSFVRSRQLGRVASNDTFIVTRRNPDSIRGADVCYVSYERYAKDLPRPKGPVVPPIELVVEVKSPSDSILEMTNKATEYLAAGVKVVMVLDPETESAAVYRADEFPHRFHNGDSVVLPDILPGFAVPVAKFFE
jgi:Uma2 family endonuclease